MNVYPSVSSCRVCERGIPRVFLRIDGKTYWRCLKCAATFLAPEFHPSPEEEQAHYRLHQNDPGDSRYRKFLSKLGDPLLSKLEGPSRGLDYGCGNGPALAAVFREAGHEVVLHDPFFADNPEALSQQYDFIICAEVVEHFHDPLRDFRRLDRLLKPRAWLGIMTCFQTDDDRFADWHYRKDPTHVVFYREETLRVVAEQREWECEIPCKDVALMQKGDRR
ncbi:class I SAM-dependent methyltransferase [Lutibaculum baratangense]|uniref:Methyltransferase-related protein n=1 Tax=Lutibaculum baratangense AMV1 TaxID=631454 RepID=V4RJE5_9HYPH|nr:class I SAM-dependent methyltransferase [Lutibaculum baratangense]ESR25439.1 methyltransferase-related protein [Lutibaculum baratangense AMV1]